MANQVTFSLKDALEKFGKSMEGLSNELTQLANNAIGEVAFETRRAILQKASEKLHSTYKDYEKALDIRPIDANSYLISLTTDWANTLEEGYGPYNMRESMLSSHSNVSIGRRAGQPWVQHTKDRPGHPSHRYAYVPFEKHPHSKAPQNADMAAGIKSMMATNAAGAQQRITEIFRDAEGNALHGIKPVAIGKSDNPFLNNLVKYQHKVVSKSGKESIHNVYVNYKIISDLSTNWNNKGFEGLKAFPDAAAAIPGQLDAIVQKLFGGS